MAILGFEWGYGKGMYVILLDYTAPREEVDYLLPDHTDWLNQQYDDGYFLASGLRRPRTGGVVIARPMSRLKLEALMATNPLVERRMAHYDLIEFDATRTAPGLLALNEALSA
jgi:uncharacterized protein YciI